MELADTSAWINRAKDATVRIQFDELLANGLIATCDIVKMELLWTARDGREFADLLEDLESLESIPIDRAVWRRAVDVFAMLADRGPLHHRQVKIPDLLVAAAAESAGMPVCHYDRDFEVIAAVTGQPTRAIAPIGSVR